MTSQDIKQKNAARPDAGAANYVKIFDTTLRDGEQSPGASMTLEEKLQVAELLEEMGVDIIEAGFPIASNGDFEAVQEVAKLVKNAVVCGLARSGPKDINRAGEALKIAKRPRIHTFISTSPVHMKHKLQMEPEQVLDAVVGSDQLAHARGIQLADIAHIEQDILRPRPGSLFDGISHLGVVADGHLARDVEHRGLTYWLILDLHDRALIPSFRAVDYPRSLAGSAPRAGRSLD